MRLGILCTQGSRMAFSASVGELVIDRTAKWVHASRGQLTSVGLPERMGITTWKVLPSISDSQEKGCSALAYCLIVSSAGLSLPYL